MSAQLVASILFVLLGAWFSVYNEVVKKPDKWGIISIFNLFIVLKIIFFVDKKGHDNFFLNCILFFGSYVGFCFVIKSLMPKK